MAASVPDHEELAGHSDLPEWEHIRSLLRQGRLNEAQALLRLGEAADPRNPRWANAWAVAAARAGNLSGAAEALSRWAASAAAGPERRARVMSNLAAIRLIQGDSQGTLRYGELAVRDDPFLPTPHFISGLVRAGTVGQEAVAIEPGEPLYLYPFFLADVDAKGTRWKVQVREVRQDHWSVTCEIPVSGGVDVSLGELLIGGIPQEDGFYGACMRMAAVDHQSFQLKLPAMGGWARIQRREFYRIMRFDPVHEVAVEQDGEWRVLPRAEYSVLDCSALGVRLASRAPLARGQEVRLKLGIRRQVHPVAGVVLRAGLDGTAALGFRYSHHRFAEDMHRQIMEEARRRVQGRRQSESVRT